MCCVSVIHRLVGMEVERDMLVCPLCGGWGGRGIAVSR